MLELKQYLNRRLTTWQVAAVVAIVAVLAGFGYLAFSFITARILEAKINAAIPKACAAVREQRAGLVKAIEAYKAHFGVYPPDHVLSRQPLVVDAVTNTLLYELTGVVYDTTNKWFRVGRLEAADAKYVREFFQIDGFRNCAERADQVTHFLPAENLPVKQFHDDPDVFGLSFTVPFEGLDEEVLWQFVPGSWRYVSSAPTNNPGRFDLWVEVGAGNRRVTIGNWKAVE